MLQRPAADEHDEYYSVYIDRVPDGDILEILTREIERTGEVLAKVPPEREGFRYASGKWSVREVVGHMLDAERVFAHRALWFARADPAPLPGMDQDTWAGASNANDISVGQLFEELALARLSHLAMFRGFDDEIWLRRGTASGCQFTVRSLPYILAGHELHHRSVLEEKYLDS